MKTDELIDALAAEAGRQPTSPDRIWLTAAALGVLATLATFAVVVGKVRPDVATALLDPRFLMKFAVTLSLAASAMLLLRSLAIPGQSIRTRALWLIVPIAILTAGVVLELASLPASSVMAKLVGTNSLVCLVEVPLLGIGPVAILVVALRHAAPTRPMLAGFVAGLAAGGLAAAVYAAHCPDDSPLFLAVWYSLAIAGLGLVGAIGARAAARW